MSSLSSDKLSSLGLVTVSGLAGVSLLVDLFNWSLGFDLLIPSKIPDGSRPLTLVSNGIAGTLNFSLA